MTQKIGIGVEAQLDTGTVEQQINAFGQRVAQANKVQYSPISVKSLDDLETARKRFEQLLKVHSELNRRMKATNQQDKSPWGLDFESMFPGDRSRANNMRAVFEQVFGNQFSEIAAQPPPPKPAPGAPGSPGSPGGGAGNGPSWSGMGVGVAQAGLRAMGPAGGVAAGSLGTGMSSGFGAGLMGLMGGMLALGVGKVVGSVVEKISQAEDNNVALDRLKRTLGDVNVSFNALKSVVHDGADNLRITYSEAGQLAQQFVKLGNVSSGQAKDLASELEIGVGMSRAFGLDPSQGVGAMGQMRGLGVTRDTQESRRFALLIGETIGKSGAFAKADEVMDAIAGYANMQTRASVGGANVGGYAGMFSSLVGSGLAGLDPSGAGALLSRVNASLAAGGAKGEASQFLTAIVGQRMGLDPLQTQVLREGGMFSTMSGSFGAGSAYERYMGNAGPEGDKTFFEATMEAIDSMPQYANNPLLKAQAVANHTGVNMRQAMALMSVKPGQMGGMMEVLQASGIDINNMRGDGIAGVSKALYGTGDDRRALANSLAGGRGDRKMSEADLAALDKAMKSGGEDEQKRLLASLAAKYGQESTQGQDIRDSKNSLDNIKTNMADKLVPLVNEMRHGIMFMAGGKEKLSSSEITRRMITADSNDRIGQINSEYKNKISTKENEWRFARSEGLRTNDPALLAKADEIEKEIARLKEEQNKKIERENAAREASIASIEESTKARLELTVLERDEAERRKELLGASSGAPRYGAVPEKAGRAGAGATAVGAAPAGGKVSGNVSDFVQQYGPLADKLSAELNVPADAILGHWGLETGWGKSVIPGTNNLGNIKDFSGAGPKAKDNMTGSVDSYRAYGTVDDFGSDFSNLLRKRRYSGALGTTNAKDYFAGLKAGGYAEDPNYVSSGTKAAAMAARARQAAQDVGATPPGGLAGYGEGPAYSRSVISRIGKSDPPDASKASRASEVGTAPPEAKTQAPTVARAGVAPAPTSDPGNAKQSAKVGDAPPEAKTQTAAVSRAGATPLPDGQSGSSQPVAKVGATPLPSQLFAANSAGNPAQGLRVSADDITVRVVDQNGMPRQPPQTIQTRVSTPSPFGLRVN